MNDDHIKDQLCARIEELEKEKLELNEQLDALQKERDELSAHVESARPMVEAYRSQIGGALWALDGEELGFAEAAEEWLVAIPENSLARLIAEKQADVLEAANTANKCNGIPRLIRQYLVDEAAELRRQAEGGEV